MKTIIKWTLVAAVFCAGLLICWRATILTAGVDIVSSNCVSVTAWGQTDVYKVDHNPDLGF